MSGESRPIVAAVLPGQPDAVVQYAARLARCFGTRLECAHVEVASYAALLDGGTYALPIDPDGTDSPAAIEARLRLQLAEQLHAEPVVWDLSLLAGEPALALGRFAESVDAELIVVGTRERGVFAGLREFLSGSVAAHLTHRQHRPVVVVPLRPLRQDEPLPWEGA